MDAFVGLVYSFGGFVAGFALGHWTKDLHAIRNHVCDFEECPHAPALDSQ